MAVSSKAFVDELSDFGDESVEFYTADSGLFPFPTNDPPQAVPRKYRFGKSLRYVFHSRPHRPLKS